MTQFADMTPVEKDEFRIKRLLKRKRAAELQGKRYVLKRSGHIPRLIREYPESFTWLADANPETVPFKRLQEAERESARLRRSNLSLQQLRTHHETQLAIAGDKNRALQRRIAELEAAASRS